MYFLKLINQSFHFFPVVISDVSTLPPAKRAVSQVSKHAFSLCCQFTIHAARQELFVHNRGGDTGGGNIQSVTEIILQRMLHLIVVCRGGEKFARVPGGAHAAGVSNIAPQLIRALFQPIPPSKAITGMMFSAQKIGVAQKGDGRC